jgi:hypothetical protein
MLNDIEVAVLDMVLSSLRWNLRSVVGRRRDRPSFTDTSSLGFSLSTYFRRTRSPEPAKHSLVVSL